MFGVMELHDLARDGGFECGVVVYRGEDERLTLREDTHGSTYMGGREL